MILIPGLTAIKRRDIRQYLTRENHDAFDVWIEYRDFGGYHLPEPGGLNQQSNVWRQVIRIMEQEFRRWQENEAERRRTHGR